VLTKYWAADDRRNWEAGSVTATSASPARLALGPTAATTTTV